MTQVDISPATAMKYVARYAPATASIIYEGGDLTAAEVDARSARLAAVLSEGGVGEGDRVAYLGLNSPTVLLLHLACARLKAVFIPMNFRLVRPELEYILINAQAHTLVVEPGFLSMADLFIADVPVKRYIVIDDDPADPLPSELSPRWERLSALMAASTQTRPIRPCYADDLAALLYTSGTTGRAKGVMLTHGNIWWNHANVDSVVETKRNDVTYAAAPLFHIGGLNAMVLRTLIRGGTVLIRRAFDPAMALADFQKYRVSTLFGVPAMFAGIARVPGFAEADLSSVKAAIVAGAPVPPPLIALYADHDLFLQQAWGLTETAPFATYLPAELTREKIGSAGVPMPYTQVKVINPAGGAVIETPNTRGELCVRGPNVTSGYWRNPEATATAIDEEAWFHTGDIGYCDEDGYLFIVDRLKDMIISGGENVYPAEVENALGDMPGVLEVAVVGAPDPQWGETVVAVLTCAEGVQPTIDAVREHAGRSLARYKLPTRVVTVEVMPRNGSGKLDKVAIRSVVADAKTTTPA